MSRSEGRGGGEMKCCGTCKHWTAQRDATEFPFGQRGDCSWWGDLPNSIVPRRRAAWSKDKDCPCWEEKECSQPS
jgi:hypothetical protein